MEEIVEIVKQQVLRYPEMKPQDVVKLIYQNEFGGEHMMIDSEESLGKLKEEMAMISKDENETLLEPIGNHYARLNLKKAMTIYSVEEINDFFVRSSRVANGSLADFLHKLKSVRKEFTELGFLFSEEEMNAYLAYYRGNAYPAVHHSSEYRKAYDPHYRVVRDNILDI